MYFYFGLQGWRSYKLNILDTISVFFFWAKMKLDWLHKNGYRLFQIPALKTSPNQDSEGNNTNKEEFVAILSASSIICTILGLALCAYQEWQNLTLQEWLIWILALNSDLGVTSEFSIDKRLKSATIYLFFDQTLTI